MICYAYDSNVILSVPIKNLSAAYQQVYTILNKAGFHPWLYKLENKISTEIESFQTAADITSICTTGYESHQCCQMSDSNMEESL